MKVKDQIQSLLKNLNDGLYEKEEVMALALLSAIAGESIFLLGAPGVAKSLIARRLKFAFQEGKAFEYLMNRFSTPDEIFGPVSISELKNDNYVRKVDDYLPGATVVFLDEIWKAGPSIQNALLTVLNEKVYRNGAQEIKVPMKALISASNELPSKGEGLEALWDRFIVRLVVGGITSQAAFNTMISAKSKAYEDNVDAKLKITSNQYDAWSQAIEAIKVPENVFQVVQVIRATIQASNAKNEDHSRDIYVSDRRWRKVIRLMRSSAFLNGREEVDLMDCFLIAHCIWDDAEQIEVVQRILKTAIEQHGYKLKIDLKALGKTVADFNDEVLKDTKNEKIVNIETPKIYHNEYYFVEGQSRPLIKKEDFEVLTSTPKYCYLAEDSPEEWRRTNYHQRQQVSVSTKKYHLNVDGKPFKIKTEIHIEATTTTFKPNDRLKKAWDDQVTEFLTITDHLKSQIHEFRSKDLAHLRDNAFVPALKAMHVETNILDTIKAIEKLEVEVKRIQHYYENVKDSTETKKS